MSLKLFTRKKKAIQKHEEEQQQQKVLLDVMKMNALDKMVSLLEELNVNINTNEIITTTNTNIQPQVNQKIETKSKIKQPENTFIPSIDTSNVSSKNITSVKKKTKKRKISDTVDKLNSKTKKKTKK
jgi:hypothetical protein